jgi:hypothetical protein
MYAVVQCNSTSRCKEHELWLFPWESNIIQKLTEQESRHAEGQKLVKNILLNGML